MRNEPATITLTTPEDQSRALRRLIGSITRRMVQEGLGTHCLRTISAFAVLPAYCYKHDQGRGRDFEYSMRSLMKLGLVTRQKADDEEGRSRWLYTYTPKGLDLFTLPPKKEKEKITE